MERPLPLAAPVGAARAADWCIPLHTSARFKGSLPRRSTEDSQGIHRRLAGDLKGTHRGDHLGLAATAALALNSPHGILAVWKGSPGQETLTHLLLTRFWIPAGLRESGRRDAEAISSRLRPLS